MGDSDGSGGGGFVVLMIVLVVLALYFTPTIIAFARGIADRGTVLVLNLFLGWTFVGWVVSLAMAARSRPEPVVLMAQPMISPAGPQPGWYRDPSDPLAERWWDGAGWGDTRRAVS
ncbi:superinfection immunity protein [Modestobacter marinus]|uniref:superinfection immunity protein n=1 Tax=Modestobacter marinus TaxID=477641 RepID=UPI00201B278D|nr:superinfection immunity protein [Modestobacter marinus]